MDVIWRTSSPNQPPRKETYARLPPFPRVAIARNSAYLAAMSLRERTRPGLGVLAAVVAMRETAIIAAAGFLVFIMAAALLVYFLVP